MNGAYVSLVERCAWHRAIEWCKTVLCCAPFVCVFALCFDIWTCFMLGNVNLEEYIKKTTFQECLYFVFVVFSFCLVWKNFGKDCDSQIVGTWVMKTEPTEGTNWFGVSSLRHNTHNFVLFVKSIEKSLHVAAWNSVFIYVPLVPVKTQELPRSKPYRKWRVGLHWWQTGQTLLMHREWLRKASS